MQAEPFSASAEEVATGIDPKSDSAASTQTDIDVAKVGEPSSQQAKAEAEQTAPAIAKVFSHSLDDRQAATVYVRNIPVLTFLGEAIKSSPADDASTELRKLATPKAEPMTAEHPLWKANQLVAEFNQLNQNNDVDAEAISVRWEDSRYIIEHGEAELLTLDDDVILPDTTGSAPEDALQATNRLRRLLGPKEAAALTEVANLPAPPAPQPQVVARAGSFYQEGEASWYGPGFHGRTSASGETFNQWAMTAAHKYLPFGTLVRVTNLNNGAAVNVRINDRGPYTRGRVIDLSAAAADAIGMSGVAHVRIDVLN